jgi:hypothetical protein
MNVKGRNSAPSTLGNQFPGAHPASPDRATAVGANFCRRAGDSNGLGAKICHSPLADWRSAIAAVSRELDTLPSEKQ